MVITNNKKNCDDFIRRARSFGYNKKKMKSNLLYDVDLLGYNFRMNRVGQSHWLSPVRKIRSFFK